MTAAAPPTTALEQLGDALVQHDCRPRSTPSGLQARCPAHDDREPSLSVGRRDDCQGVVVCCHAGCSTDDVLAALGLAMPDLFDEPRSRPPGHDEAERAYRYVDEQGQLLFEVIRKPGSTSGSAAPTGAAATSGVSARPGACPTGCPSSSRP